jgi:hypothetical protein
MKTARRQELRTNELSQQIDQISDYVKQNAAMLTIIVTAAAILTAGGFWYVKSRQSRIMDGWAMLNDAEVLKDMRGAVDQFRTLAEENRSRALTLAAWLRIGEVSMSKVANPDPGAAADANWSETATNAYTRILEEFPDDISAVGLARVSLGVLAENKNEVDKARQQYQSVLDDSRLKESPFAGQARYRLDGLARWSTPIVFAPAPPVTTSAPDLIMTPPSAVTLPLLPTTAPAIGPAGGVPIAPIPIEDPTRRTNPPATTQPKG